MRTMVTAGLGEDDRRVALVVDPAHFTCALAVPRVFPARMPERTLHTAEHRDALHALLAAHAHASELALLVPRARTGEPSIRPEDADDEALRHGWTMTRIERVDALRHARLYARAEPGRLGDEQRARLRALAAEGRLEPGGLALHERTLALETSELETLRVSLAPLLDCRSLGELRRRISAPLPPPRTDEGRHAEVLAMWEIARSDLVRGRARDALVLLSAVERITRREPDFERHRLWLDLADAYALAGHEREARRWLARIERAWTSGPRAPRTRSVPRASVPEDLRLRADALAARLAETAPPATKALERYRHARFGLGTLLDSSGDRLRIRFDDGSERVLMGAHVERVADRRAPLER